jgi:hypothetical protein
MSPGRTPHRRPFRRIGWALLAVSPLFLQASPATAVEFTAGASVGSAWTDNVFVRRTPEWDLSIDASLELGLEFAGIWSVRYEGEADIFTRQTDLTSHQHRLELRAIPSFGAGDRHEADVSAWVETLRNLDPYAELNFVGGGLAARVLLEPADWVAWQARLEARYRAFYDDPEADAADLLVSTQARFTLPTRTTLTPRFAYGFRYNSGLKATSAGFSKRDDHQVDAGIHLSQALWESAGLQAGYQYRYLFATSAALTRKLTQSQFALLTSDFVWKGHRAYLGFKQLLPKGFFLLARVEYRQVAFPGWPATDSAGADTGEDRRDHRLAPSATLAWERDLGPVGLEIQATYSFLRQWSRSYDYDTRANETMIRIGLEY